MMGEASASSFLPGGSGSNGHFYKINTLNGHIAREEVAYGGLAKDQNRVHHHGYQLP